MAVRIRLRRVGKAKHPHYRLVVADSTAPRNGKFIENLGHYDPTKEGALFVKADRARYWIGKGARPTATARDLLVKSGLDDKEVPPQTRE